MKKLNLIIGAALSFGMLQACHNGAKDSTQTADSVNAVKDTTKTDTTKNMAAIADDDDAKFAVKAASGGMTEVTLGKLAQEKASSNKVKDFGAMMATDHTKAGDELMALAKTKNITLPSVPGTDDQKTIDDLSKKSGSDFDKAYVDDMVADHKADIKLFEDAEKNCKDADIKAFATKTLPVLHKHLDAINAIKAGM